VLGAARSLNKNLVVLAGDTHNAWANELKDINGTAVGVEFATPSVTSPGFESFFTESPATVAEALEELITPLVYMDSARRGYMLITATATECRADWMYVNTIASRNFTAVSDKSLKVVAGAATRGRIVAA
jgi:alkaline phosphatase D